MKKFDEIYDAMWVGIFEKGSFCSNDKHLFKPICREFYEKGLELMKEECVNTLIKQMEKCNDIVPKTLYPSEKFKSAIKTIKGVNM